jgi:hypothetical protein
MLLPKLYPLLCLPPCVPALPCSLPHLGQQLVVHIWQVLQVISQGISRQLTTGNHASNLLPAVLLLKEAKHT